MPTVRLVRAGFGFLTSSTYGTHFELLVEDERSKTTAALWSGP